MSSNHFGTLFKITTWGESHGKAIGVTIDGCPAGLAITEEDIQKQLDRRAPGNSPYTSPRKESDQAELLSGVFEGETTGAPITILIRNHNADSSKYEPIKHLLRPGHANATYLQKYGVFDYRGGGRASARETACRVAAGAVAKKLLQQYNIQARAYLDQVGAVFCEKIKDWDHLEISPLFCPDPQAEKSIQELILEAKQNDDSVGGIVAFHADNLPQGLGDPVYEKLEANLAKAMLSIPASKGFEIGSGFHSVFAKGSEHNDAFIHENQQLKTRTNHSGGVLGGISNGMPVYGRVVFKPTSSIMKTQQTLDTDFKVDQIQLPEGSKHDPCVAIRAVPVVEAMLALVLADALLLNRKAKL